MNASIKINEKSTSIPGKSPDVFVSIDFVGFLGQTFRETFFQTLWDFGPGLLVWGFTDLHSRIYPGNLKMQQKLERHGLKLEKVEFSLFLVPNSSPISCSGTRKNW